MLVQHGTVAQMADPETLQMSLPAHRRPWCATFRGFTHRKTRIGVGAHALRLIPSPELGKRHVNLSEA